MLLFSSCWEKTKQVRRIIFWLTFSTGGKCSELKRHLGLFCFVSTLELQYFMQSHWDLFTLGWRHLSKSACTPNISYFLHKSSKKLHIWASTKMHQWHVLCHDSDIARDRNCSGKQIIKCCNSLGRGPQGPSYCMLLILVNESTVRKKRTAGMISLELFLYAVSCVLLPEKNWSGRHFQKFDICKEGNLQIRK